MIIIIVCAIFKSRIKNVIISIFCYFTKAINMVLYIHTNKLEDFKNLLIFASTDEVTLTH